MRRHEGVDGAKSANSVNKERINRPNSMGTDMDVGLLFLLQAIPRGQEQRGSGLGGSVTRKERRPN